MSGGAGIIIKQDEFTPVRLSEELRRIFSHPNNILSNFSEMAHSQARPRAAESLAKACFQLAETHS